MRINLKVWKMIKIIPAILLFAYYHLMVTGHHLQPQVVTSLSVVFLLLMKAIKKHGVEPDDELSNEIQRRVDALCYKLAVVVLVILIMPFLFLNPVQADLIGYLIVGCIALLAFFQAAAFFVMDRKGI